MLTCIERLSASENIHGIQKGDPGGVAHDIPYKLIKVQIGHRDGNGEVQVRQDVRLRSTGAGNGGDDVPLVQSLVGLDTFQGVGMRINGQQPGFRGFSVYRDGMFHDNGLAQIVLEHGPHNTFEHHGNSCLSVESALVIGPVPVEAEVQALVREVPLTKIAPPFIRGAKQHAGLKNPAVEIVQN